MDIIAACKDREIARVIDPTVAAFAPILKRKKAFIKEIPMNTFRYASGDKGELDIFYPLTATEKTPILFFIYGGGFNTGEKSISPKTFGLVYSCVGAYWARRGFIVVIPDYRLVPNVQFPGPAEDVRDAVRWVIANKSDSLVSEGSPNPDIDTIVMMGHSAGAAHIATMLFHPNILFADDPLRKKIKAAILESPPYDLTDMTMDWGETARIHRLYWGTLEGAKANDPLHLFRRLPNEVIERLPKLLMVEGEFEPPWLIKAGDAFQKEVSARMGKLQKRLVAKGHNHVSLNWALSSGQGEDWAEEVFEWYESTKESS